ncbi:MAG TPA: hypothetical protein VN228_19805, partial [Pyrinomonadaceae bacterium]|nr:hypothetical protein [Pyrinomonadaceae bacterium]
LGKADCQKGLAAAGVNVPALIRAFNNFKPRPDSAPSSVGYNIFYAETSTEPGARQFMQTERGKGAGAFVYGQDIMVRDKFFGAHGGAKISVGASRALALIHEAIHLTGRTDASFGGSSKLNDVVIQACFSRLYAHNDMSIVVP